MSDDKKKIPIVVIGKYLEKFVETHPDNDRIKSLFKRSDWSDKKIKWWLGRILDRLEKEAQIYQEQRQDIINDNAKKWDHDGSFKSTAFGSVGQEITYKKGDVKTFDNGTIDWGKNDKKVEKEFKDLREAEVIINIWKIILEEEDDIPKDLPPDEIKLLLPVMEIPSLDNELIIDDKKMEEFKKKDK